MTGKTRTKFSGLVHASRAVQSPEVHRIEIESRHSDILGKNQPQGALMELGKVEKLILEWCVDNKIRAGNVLSARPLMYQLSQKLNPKESDGLMHSLENLVALGYLASDKDNFRLTDGGFHFIYDDEFDRQRFSYPAEPAPMTSNTYNFHGTGQNIQIGDNNSQQIVSAIELLAAEIDKANVTPEEKHKAKQMLLAALQNPVVSGLLSGVGATGLAKLLGMG